jgi:hypothetical protein
MNTNLCEQFGGVTHVSGNMTTTTLLCKEITTVLQFKSIHLYHTLVNSILNHQI